MHCKAFNDQNSKIEFLYRQRRKRVESEESLSNEMGSDLDLLALNIAFVDKEKG